jgi:hypothetical protein
MTATVTVTKFVPTSKIKNGKNGLANTPGSKSHVKITGTNLADELDVFVYYPAGTTTLVWKGKTYGTNRQQTHCRAKVNNESTVAGAQGRIGAGDTEVSVTVGNSTPQNFQVLTGPPLDGRYSVACNGTGGGSYKWLAPDGTTDVNLSDAINPPVWVFTLLDNQQGNCYTIQCDVGGTAYYLTWANSGTSTAVSLGTDADAGTGWLLDSDCILAVDIPANDPGPPNCTFLNGDTQSGTVNILEQADPNGGTLWSLGTYGGRPPNA